MKYSEKLRDPRWQKKRLEIFNRDDWTCQSCYLKSVTLCVHHLKYISGKDPWDYPDDLLLTLCEECHAGEYEERESTERSLIDTLKVKGFLTHDLMTVEAAFDLIESRDDMYKVSANIEDYVSGLLKKDK